MLESAIGYGLAHLRELRARESLLRASFEVDRSLHGSDDDLVRDLVVLGHQLLQGLLSQLLQGLLSVSAGSSLILVLEHQYGSRFLCLQDTE